MIHIFTSVVIVLTLLFFKKLYSKVLKDEYKFHVVDSVDPEIKEQFQLACSLNELEYYRKPPTNKPLNPAQACAHTVQWTYVISSEKIIVKI